MGDDTDQIIPDEYPNLAFICWNRDTHQPLAAEEAFGIYEANWRHVDKDNLSEKEDALIQDLTARFGGGCFLGRG